MLPADDPSSYVDKGSVGWTPTAVDPSVPYAEPGGATVTF